MYLNIYIYTHIVYTWILYRLTIDRIVRKGYPAIIHMFILIIFHEPHNSLMKAVYMLTYFSLDC